MLDLRMIDELTRKLGEALPPGVNQARDEAERRFRSVLTSAFERMNLVSREEFEAQCQVLEETRAKLAELEERVEQSPPD
jgi:BMFP domain-containing protein YqiC